MKKRNLLLLAAITFGMGNLWALDKVGDVYQITNGQDLVDFANLVNGDAANSGAAAVLTTDIDLSGVEFPTIGRDGSRYWGTFDGQGHRILNMKIEGSTKELGLFNVVSSATIKNLILDSSCVINSGDCTAALVGCCNGSGVLTIENVGIECDVTGTGANAAAFVGCNYSGGALETQIRNCYNTGNITGGRESAVFSGWFGNNGNTRVTNCWNTGKVNGADGNNSLGRGIGGGQFVNTYDLNADNGRINETILAEYAETWMTSGQLTYILNGNKSEDVAWYQVIGTDPYPTPFYNADGIVYANGYMYCDGNLKPGSKYENEKKDAARDAHNYGEWGFCVNEHDGIVCDAIQPDFLTANGEGYFEIATAKQLNWFAVWTNQEGNNALKAKLMNNLDMTEVANFPGLCGANQFAGEFDGQFFTISNLKMNYDRQGVGFVNNATVGATIKNLTFDSTCEFRGNNAVAAFIGAVRGSEGDLFIINCGNEAPVTATNQNAAGFIGCKYDDNVIPNLTNCYQVGIIRGGWDCGSFSGWMPKAKLTNCYSVAGYPTESDTYGFEQGQQFGRGWSQELNNCYDLGTGDWGTNNGSWGEAFQGDRKLTEENIKNGVLLAGLGENVWHQKKDAHPVLNKDYDLDENFAGQKFYAHENANVTFYRTTVANTWNTFAAPVALTAEQVEEVFGEGAKVAEFKGIDGEWASFETVTATEAGKAYLVMPTAAKTTFAVKADLSDAAPATADFQGVYTPTELTANDLFVAAGNKLQAAKSGNLKAYRAYFKDAAASGAKFFTVDGEANGIIGLNGEVMTAKEVYNLNGQRVNAAQKGVYIVNGKKVVM